MRFYIPISRKKSLYNIVCDDFQIGRKILFISFRKHYPCVVQIALGIGFIF